uniref:RNA exonuclease 1 n=2 Tax=Aceria tosichella TaxID=561515 RepID=A0A6G1SLF0_9ACAR
MPKEELIPYGYPYRDPDNPELRMAPLGKDGQKLTLREELASSYTCDRCAKVYRIGEDGMPLPTTSKCIFHPGHLWNVRISRALEKRYSCCKGDPSAGGCNSNVYHVHRGDLELENYRGYVETQPKPERDPHGHGIYALDCEMCHTTYGLELTRVTVINHKHDVVYEKLVKPRNPILDYNTKFSGIKPGDLDDVDTTLADVQRDLLSMFSNKTILVGHSLDSDMKALKIFHKHFIDTAQLFPHKRGLPFKRALRTLMVENLQVVIQEDAGHDSKEDASAALRLVMWNAKTSS